jgi:antitoxin (DNA-binding transcriptional repressor) of toxin-antitoxin stability system
MKTMAVSAFKARALSEMDRVAKSRVGMVITKRGKPIVQILPYQESPARMTPGKLSHTLVFEEDILTPLGSGIWESAR